MTDGEGAELTAPNTAYLFVEMLRRGLPFERTWPWADPDLRLSLAQLWVHDNPRVMSDPLAPPTRQELVDALVADAPTHPLWGHFVFFIQRRIHAALLGGTGDRELRPGQRPRPLAPDLEAARLFPVDELPVDENDDPYVPTDFVGKVLTLIMRRRPEGWRVAGWGDGVYCPGWPPTIQSMVQPED